MSKKVGKVSITEKEEVEPETETSGSNSGDLPPRTARASRFGAGDGGGRGERGLVKGVGWFGRLAQFLRDVRAEMKRVSWPTATEVKNTTIITLVAVVFFAVYLFMVDRIWTFLLTQLNQLLNSITGT